MPRIAVFLKSALDPNMLRVSEEGQVDIDATPLGIDEYGRNAIEEAVKIKEAQGGEIHILQVLTWGPLAKRLREAEMVLREALAMGADEAHLVADENLIPGDPLTTSKVLAKLSEVLGGYDLYLAGEGSMDSSSFQVPVRISSVLSVPAITHVRRLDITNGSLVAVRDLEDHYETVEVRMPAILSVTGEINKPRIPTILQIRRAATKPIKRYSLSDLGIEELDMRVESLALRGVGVKRRGKVIGEDRLDEAVREVIQALIRMGVLRG